MCRLNGLPDFALAELTLLPLDLGEESAEPPTAAVSSGWLVLGVVSKLRHQCSCYVLALWKHWVICPLCRLDRLTRARHQSIKLLATGKMMILSMYCSCGVSTVFWTFCLIGTCICRYTSGDFHQVKPTGFSAKQLHRQFIWNRSFGTWS